MKRLALSLLLLLTLSCAAYSQTAPDAAELTKLLNEFLAGASRNDPAVHERFWADDLIYTRSAGRRVSKAEIMRDVSSAPAPKPTDPKTIYTAEDVRIQQYGDTAVVAFRLVATTDAGETKQVANLLNSGTFVKRNGKWQVVNWQSTRMPREDSESRSEVATLETAFHEAIASGDVERITALTHTTFNWTRGTQQLSQQQLLAEVSAKRLKYEKPNAAKTTVSMYGDSAIVRGEFNPQKPIRYTLMFINVAGAWKAVSMHTTE